MGCSSREQIVEVFDVVDGALDRLCELTFDVLTTPERWRFLERLERRARRMRTPGHGLIKGGCAVVFNKPSHELGGFREVVEPRAFAKSEADGWPGVVCRFEHNALMLLGTHAAGTLRLPPIEPDTVTKLTFPKAGRTYGNWQSAAISGRVRLVFRYTKMISSTTLGTSLCAT